MIQWNKMTDLLVTKKLSLGKGATLVATNASGNQTLVALGSSEARAVATTLTAEDSGKTIFLNSTTAFATTLPLPQVGMSFKFIVSAVPASGSHTIVTSGSANIIKGSVSSADMNAANDAAIGTGNDRKDCTLRNNDLVTIILVICVKRGKARVAE